MKTKRRKSLKTARLLVFGQLGDRLAGTGVIDEFLAVGSGSDEGGDRSVVECARYAAGVVM